MIKSSGLKQTNTLPIFSVRNRVWNFAIPSLKLNNTRKYIVVNSKNKVIKIQIIFIPVISPME